MTEKGKFIFFGFFAILVILFLSGMDGSEGDSSRIFWIILIIVIALLLFRGIQKSNKNSLDAQQKEMEFKDEFAEALEHEKFFAINTWIYPPFYGLAINNNKESLALFTNHKLQIFRSSKIISCVTKDHFSEMIESKTRGSVIVPTSKTTGTVVRKLNYVEMLIHLDDLTTPTLKIIFPNKDDAERYSSLINQLIVNNQQRKDIDNTDKLLKLYEMHEKGLINNEEFQNQKNKLM